MTCRFRNLKKKNYNRKRLWKITTTSPPPYWKFYEKNCNPFLNAFCFIPFPTYNVSDISDCINSCKMTGKGLSDFENDTHSWSIVRVLVISPSLCMIIYCILTKEDKHEIPSQVDLKRPIKTTWRKASAKRGWWSPRVGLGVGGPWTILIQNLCFT